MPFVPAANTVLVELRYTQDAQEVENTLYFQSASAPDEAGMTALGEAILTWWGAQLQTLISNECELRECLLTDLTTDSGPSVTVVTGLPLLGTSDGEAAPQNATACISFRTGFRGRARRGRNYIVGLPNQYVASNTLNSAYMAAAVTAYDTLRSDADAIGWTQVVVSRFSGSTIVDGKKVPTPRETALVTPVTSVLFADSTVDSQRGRLPNH